jgi:hypothetical protein
LLGEPGGTIASTHSPGQSSTQSPGQSGGSRAQGVQSVGLTRTRVRYEARSAHPRPWAQALRVCGMRPLRVSTPHLMPRPALCGSLPTPSEMLWENAYCCQWEARTGHGVMEGDLLANLTLHVNGHQRQLSGSEMNSRLQEWPAACQRANRKRTLCHHTMCQPNAIPASPC